MPHMIQNLPLFDFKKWMLSRGHVFLFMQLYAFRGYHSIQASLFNDYSSIGDFNALMSREDMSVMKSNGFL